MKKKGKVLLLVLIMILLTGCQTKYDAKIMLDGSVVESGILLDNKEELIDSYTKEKMSGYVNNLLRANGLAKKKYDLIENGNLAGIKMELKYKSLEDYTKRSKAIDYLFKSIEIEKKNKETIIRSIPSDYEVIYYENDGELNYINSTITVGLPYEVIETNADSRNEDTNTFTWNINDSFEGIYIKYYNNRYFSKDIGKLFKYATANTYFNLVTMVIGGILIIVILVLVFELKKRKRIGKI